MRWLLVLMLVSGEARADLRAAIDNDILAAGKAGDDDGFTNDIDVRLWRPYRDYQLGGALFDRWVTEEPRPAGRRRDLLELVATGERSWLRGPLVITAAGRVGPVFTGNLGGRWMQNAFHTTCRCGAPLDQGLQHIYQDGRDAGALIGTRGRASIGDPISTYVALDDQLSVGTGVTFVDAAFGSAARWRHGGTELGAHLEIAEQRFHVEDAGLGLPGGYRPGWQHAFRFGLSVEHGRFRVEYEHHSNEGGSGSAIGIVAVTVKQAGTAY